MHYLFSITLTFQPTPNRNIIWFFQNLKFNCVVVYLKFNYGYEYNSNIIHTNKIEWLRSSQYIYKYNLDYNFS